MIKPTKSINANLFFDAAQELGLNYKIINKSLTLGVIFNQNQQIYIKGCILSVNNSVSNNLSKNKVSTFLLLKQNDLKIPNFKTFCDQKKAIAYVKELQENFVVKPVMRSLAWGVTVNPQNTKEKIQAVEEAFSYGKEIIIEEYIKGKDYRITVFNNEIIAISERIPAYVIGNGINSIQQLIEQKNQKRLAQELPVISIENKDISYLRSKDINLQTIPQKGKHIRLKLGCNMGIGGETKRVTIDEVPEENLRLFINATKSLYLKFGGIDFITSDITQPYTKVGGAINEINSAPMQEVHCFDATPPENYSTIKILQKYFNL